MAEGFFFWTEHGEGWVVCVSKGGETFEFSNFFFASLSPLPSRHCPLEDSTSFVSEKLGFFPLHMFSHCPEMATAHARVVTRQRRRVFTEGRHFHHDHSTHPHLLLQSDFNSVNCYEGSLIAKCRGCQNSTVTRFLLSHFTAVLRLTLDTQAWRSPVVLVGYCNKMAFLSYTKC